MIQSTIRRIQGLDQACMLQAKNRQDSLIKPKGSLGRLEDLSILLSGIERSARPVTFPRAVIAFAADHGVYAESIAPNEQSITRIQAENFCRGITGIGALCKQTGASLRVVDVGINCQERLYGVIDRKVRPGTWNLATQKAMSREEAMQAIEIGIEEATVLLEQGAVMLGVGEMGIGNTTASAAVLAVMGGFAPREVTGKGAGLEDRRLSHKVRVIERALALHALDKKDPLGVLSAVGGFEIGAMTGAMLACAASNAAIVLDGFISYASAMLAIALCPGVKEYMIASHCSAEGCSQAILEKIGLAALLSLQLRLGEGSGAALAFPILDAAVYTYTHMATFEEAGFIV